MSVPPYPQTGEHVVVRAFGETPLEAIEEHIHLEPQPAPTPDQLSPTDVVVAIRAAAVGWVDLIMASGLYQHLAQPPYTPGLEYSGVVAWVGSDVEHVSVGDRVIADGLLTGPRSKGAHQRWGGFATYGVAPREAVVPLPDALSFDQGAQLLGNYETAYHALVTRARVRPGESVLVHGASGSTGLAAVHVAKLLGATVIATGRTPEKLAVVAEQGADHVVCTAHDDGTPGLRRFRDDVKELTGGKGVDVVYDGVGGETSLESLRCVSFGARFLIVGWASTPFVARSKGRRGAPNANMLPTNLIIMKGLDVLGSPAVIATMHDPTIRPERLERILGWARSGDIKPFVSRSFDLQDFESAMKAKWQSSAVGGVVLRVS